MNKFAVLKQDWKYPWEYLVLNTTACIISIIPWSKGCSGTDLILELMFTEFFYQPKTATIINVVAETITTTAVTWIIKNLTNTNIVTNKQNIKTILCSYKNCQKKFPNGEDKIRGKKYMIIELKHSACKKPTAEELMPDFTFESIFLYYLHSAYHYNRGFFYSFAK